MWLPPSLDDWLPEDRLALFVAEETEHRRQQRAGVGDAQAVTEAGEKAAVTARPKPKAQANFTDPNSRIMKNGDGASIQAYNRRKAIVEPVFGQIMTCQNGRQLLLRGEDSARGEWRLLAACHNLRKIFRHAGTARLATATG